jgi:hypothetical protein
LKLCITHCKGDFRLKLCSIECFETKPKSAGSLSISALTPTHSEAADKILFNSQTDRGSYMFHVASSELCLDSGRTTQ